MGVGGWVLSSLRVLDKELDPERSCQCLEKQGGDR